MGYQECRRCGVIYSDMGGACQSCGMSSASRGLKCKPKPLPSSKDVELAALKARNAEMLEALRMFVGNSTVQANHPTECEQAEEIIKKATEATDD